MNRRIWGIMMVIAFICTISLYGQGRVVTLLPAAGFVNAQIVADTAAAGGLSDTTVYELKRDSVYMANAIFTVPNGTTLRLRAAAGTGQKPIIYLWETGTGSSPTRPPGNFVVLNGGNLEITNLCIVGYYEWEPERLGGVQGGLINTTAPGSSIILDGVVLSNINGQHVRTGQNTVKVSITNSILANMGALTTSNLGAGKGIDLREATCDTFIIVNNTFVNFQDRAIRHYNYKDPSAGTGLINYGLIDHNTFVNGMGFHGLLSLGNVGPKIDVTNNLFVDAFALGEDSTDATRAAEWANTGEKYGNGNNRITWIFSAPNTTTTWTVAHNYYTISDSGQAFLDDYDFPVGSPLSHHICSRLGSDSATAFTEDDVVLVKIPRLMTNMMRWYETDSLAGGAGKKKDQTNFDRTKHDYDRRMLAFYTDTLDCSYPMSADAYYGAEGSFPVGDLNWFPDLKTQWEKGSTAPTFVIDASKDDFYAALTGPDDGYLQLRSFTGNDNGVPDNDADLSAKMWFAWDESWLYFYEEVTDDMVSMSASDATYKNDCVEFKFDPQATDSVTNSIVALQMTALDTTGGTAGHTTMPYSARKTTADGYVIEVAIPWSDVKSGTETVDVGVGNVFGFAVQNHDNDNTTGARDGTVQWAAVLKDAVWNTPKYCGTVKFLADNKLQFIPSNNMTGVTNPLPYDGTEPINAIGDVAIPFKFALNQNYPNPFNPTTAIAFTVEKSDFTTLTIYNVLGQVVATPVAENLKAGHHSITFDASNLANGVYFYALKSGHQQSIRKMLLLK